MTTILLNLVHEKLQSSSLNNRAGSIIINRVYPLFTMESGESERYASHGKGQRSRLPGPFDFRRPDEITILPPGRLVISIYGN
jgi:hypothetical protein